MCHLGCRLHYSLGKFSFDPVKSSPAEIQDMRNGDRKSPPMLGGCRADNGEGEVLTRGWAIKQTPLNHSIWETCPGGGVSGDCFLSVTIVGLKQVHLTEALTSSYR